MKMVLTPFVVLLVMLPVSGCQNTAEQPTVTKTAAESSGVEQLPETNGDEQRAFESPLAMLSADNVAADEFAPGSDAPAIELSAVVHGPDVKSFSGDHVTVVDFWATRCVPCVRNMSHLSALQQQYGTQVQFIGVTDEDQTTVEAFLESRTDGGETWKQVLSYSIVLDRDRQTYRSFIEAADLSVIPRAFIVDRNGKVAWIGHPAFIDRPLAQIAGDEWDLSEARTQFLARTHEETSASLQKRELDVTTLGPGMSAPPLQIESVVHGTPFNGEFVEGITYVLHFWTTWSGPSQRSLSQLSSVRELYGDHVHLVGIAAEPSETVTSFVVARERQKRWTVQRRRWWRRRQRQSTGGNPTEDFEDVKYTVALDDDRSTTTRYMEAAGQKRLPCVFIINQTGHIAWIGRPSDSQGPLRKILAKQYDIEQAARLFKTERDLRNAVFENDIETTLELLSDTARSQTDSQKFVIMQLELLLSLNRQAEYSQIAAELVEANLENNELLNRIAWELAAVMSGDIRDLDVAMKAAKRANEGTGHSNAAYLDTLARVYYEQGDIEQALIWQQKAVDIGRGSVHMPGLIEVLRHYQHELSESGAESGNPARDRLNTTDDSV